MTVTETEWNQKIIKYLRKVVRKSKKNRIFYCEIWRKNIFLKEDGCENFLLIDNSEIGKEINKNVLEKKWWIWKFYLKQFE